LTPLLAAWTDRSERIVQLEESVQKGELLLDRQTVIRDRWKAMNRQMLPTAPSAAENELLKAFDRWIQGSGISVTSIKPQWRTIEERYLGLECRADGFGDIDALAKFIHQLESDPMALRVDYLEIASRDDAGVRLNFGLQVTGLLLNQTQTTTQP
jgi:Tfp pilus assembly protein PilO